MDGLRSECIRAIFALAILRAFKRFNSSLTPGKLIKYHQFARPENRDSLSSFVISLLGDCSGRFGFTRNKKY